MANFFLTNQILKPTPKSWSGQKGLAWRTFPSSSGVEQAYTWPLAQRGCCPCWCTHKLCLLTYLPILSSQKSLIGWATGWSGSHTWQTLTTWVIGYMPMLDKAKFTSPSRFLACPRWILSTGKWDLHSDHSKPIGEISYLKSKPHLVHPNPIRRVLKNSPPEIDYIAFLWLGHISL